MNNSANSIASQGSNLVPDPFVRNWLQTLTADTTLGELPSYEMTVHPDVVTSVVDRALGSSPDLPGVVIAADGVLLGMISRPMLFAQLSRPFGQELYLKRPIRLLLEAEHREPLVLPSDLLVGEAAHAALQRAAERVYDPVVIRDRDRFWLLDSHTLLIAQSRLLALANLTIRSQADVAEAANQSKSLFLANMSHEIRTPLTAILGFAENLLDPECGPVDRTTAVETILRNGHHLLQLINDILDLSKIEAGHLEVERLRFSPGEIVADVMSVLQVRADSKQIQLSLNYDGRIPGTIESDPTRFRQILMNLISNAIKFTERGEVVVRLKMVDALGQTVSTDDQDQQAYLLCEVIDSGIGMTEEQLVRIFSPFTQADESMTRRFGGTGLGLSISRRLARLLGGDILVTSRPNVGSTFALRILAGPLLDVAWHDRPTSIGRPSPPIVRSTDIRLNGRILLAEDGPDNQLLIGSFLRKHGADVTIVDNGRKAIDAAIASLEEDRPFAIVLMDMQMPILDGYAATRELRAKRWTGPILALTANAMQGDRQKCLDAGCDEFAIKPIRRAELIEQIQSLIVRRLEPLSITEMNLGDCETSGAEETPFNELAALERVGGDPELLREIAEMFARISCEWLEGLERHLNSRDAVAVQRFAHLLKNSADNIGGQAVTAAMSRLESAAANAQIEAAVLMWPDCQQQFLDLITAVESFLQKSGSPCKRKGLR